MLKPKTPVALSFSPTNVEKFGSTVQEMELCLDTSNSHQLHNSIFSWNSSPNLAHLPFRMSLNINWSFSKSKIENGLGAFTDVKESVWS